MKYDGVIFDMDGVILDSGLDNFGWMDRIRIQKAHEMGYNYDKDDALQVVQSTEISQLEEIINRKNMTRDELLEIEHRVQNAKIELIEHGVIRLFPAAEELLKDLDIPVGLATNSPKQITDFTLKFFGVRELFDEVEALKLDSLESYVNNKKPDPHLVKNVEKSLNVDEPLMVGDSKTDIEAAKNAGIDSVLVQSYSDGENVNSTYEIRSLAELNSILNR